MARKYYIPRTRSGSSMIASILTQMLDRSRAARKEDFKQRLARGELTPGESFVYQHPFFCLLVVATAVLILYALVVK